MFPRVVLGKLQQINTASALGSVGLKEALHHHHFHPHHLHQALVVGLEDFLDHLVGHLLGQDQGLQDFLDPLVHLKNLVLLVPVDCHHLEEEHLLFHLHHSEEKIVDLHQVEGAWVC